MQAKAIMQVYGRVGKVIGDADSILAQAVQRLPENNQPSHDIPMKTPRTDRKTIFSLVTVSFLLAISTFVHAQAAAHSPAEKADDYTAKIDHLIQQTSPRPFNGVVLITQHGKTKYSKAFGYSDFENKTPLTPEDNFRIMSNSKQITAVLILREVEKGKIDLQSPVRRYLPDLPQAWADQVTVHQLLNFSAGITEIDKPLSFAPGTDFLYGVTTYTMLGNIFEKTSGKTYIEAANDLFKELGMHNSFCYEEDKNNKVINGYVNANNTFELKQHPVQGKGWVDFIPAGGIVSNARDLAIWDEKLHQGKILKPASYKLMTSYDISSQHVAFGSEKHGYGYGVYVSDKTPVIYIGHSGKGLGFASIKVYFPEKDVDVIVLENQFSEDSALHYYFEIKIREIVMNSNLVK
ncbi:serine hydrolase domain-containing protein [Janthinobacterium lividum]|uniref:serine hydrolase domain-containing protein n=1 Tax=Janthinobacterium lividum TaxID=29581 RepID=UPI00196A7683|nr:serine hydrolase [Janthinobacterium lividum]